MAIVWPAIGSIYFCQLDGDVDMPGDTTAEKTRPGVDGVAYRLSGKRAGESELVGLSIVETSAEANTLITSCKALQGTLVSIVKAEQTRTNCLIRIVDGFKRRRLGRQVGGVEADGTPITTLSPAWQLVSRWIVRYAGT